MSIASCRRAIAIALLGAVVAPTACKKSPQPTPPASPQQPTAASPPAASAQQTSAGGPPAWLDHPQASPGTTVLTAIDPHTLSPSEVQFGISPSTVRMSSINPA